VFWLGSVSRGGHRFSERRIKTANPNFVPLYFLKNREIDALPSPVAGVEQNLSGGGILRSFNKIDRIKSNRNGRKSE
ncbi:MAG TPA: hypothetical protein VJ949_12975, partial [Cryomorphaceae bacterium]|nr:hypothetical protein [Cryomorphaceae bacterium]